MKIGLILSGGASKCVAHLGVVKALNEIGIPIHAYSAVSGGALLGSFLAAGVSPEETLKILLEKGTFSFYFPSLRAGGLFSLSRVIEVLKNELPVTTFEDLKTPMTLVATDIIKGETVFFNSGEILTPIIASSSYPIIFEPVEFNGAQLLDGGIMNNFPYEPLLKSCDKIIGVSVGKVSPLEKIGSVKRIVFRSLELAINESDMRRHLHADMMIEPAGLSQYPMFDFTAGKEIFEKGYTHTMAMAEELEALMKT